ncbi:MAG: DUF4430 domain-containing protein [Ruminococcaceae bacterium]|nr:DUF4430 domain-containing protein [Oscillospiraceae bacterium]
MKKGFKKFSAIVLVFTMLMSLLPMGVMADDSITVYASVVRNGEFTTGKNNETMAYVPVTLDSQSPTIDDAFTALHDTYYIDGANGYRTTQMDWGTSITRFWGVESDYVSYYNNNNYAMGLTDPVEDGAHLVFWFYQDTSGWSDAYTFFDKTTASVASGDVLNLTLMQEGNSPLSGAIITVDGVEVSDKITDAEGKVLLTFVEGGTYTVSAKSANSYIVPPVCIVTVTEEGKADAEYVAEDKEALSVIYTSGQNLKLPKTGKSGKTRIEWSSNSACVDTNTGVVTIPDEDTTVTLTATIWCNDVSDAETFPINILGRLSTAKAAIEADALKPIEYTNATEWGFGYDSATDDTNILTLAREVINDDNITVAFAENFTATDNMIAADGTISYPTDEAKEIILPLTLTFNGQSEQIDVSAVIPKHAQTKAEAIDAMKAAMVTYMNDPKVLNGNTSLNDVKTTLLLPGGKTSGLYITWTSNNESVIKVTGNPSSSSSHPSGGKYEVKINRPNVGEADVTVTLTATLVYKTTSVMCGAGPMPEESARQIIFDVVVPAVTCEEMQAVLDSAASDIKMIDKNGAVADLSNIKDNLYFPSYEGYTTTWSTTDLPIAIPDKGYDKSTVTRPVPGNNASGSITLTLTKGETNMSASFNATVIAWTDSELEAERAKLQRIADALTFDEIKNKNTDASAVTSNLYLRQSAKIDGDEVTFNTYNSGSYPYQIAWTITPTGVITFNSGTGKVTAPLHTTEVSLDAEIYLKASITGVESVRKSILVTVSGSRNANTAESLEALLDGIAAQTTNANNWESFMAMAAYEKARPSGSKLTDTAKQNMLNTSLSNISAENPDESAYSKTILDMHSIGINPKEIYPVNSNTPVDAVAGLNGISHESAIWTAAYTLLAYQQGNYSVGTQEADLVDALLEAQIDENGGWTAWETAEADATGIAILALAKYYNDNADVKVAVDKAICYLSEAQLSNGGFGGTWGENANNAACVIMGLSAVGINPDTDVRFIKNGNSVLDRLLDFAMEDNSGFVFNIGDTTASAYATQQGFPALVAAYQVIKNAAAYNVYDFSSNPLSPGRATGTGAVIVPSAPSGNSITVRVTIKADTGYWLNNKSVTISGTGATIYHALIKALENSGITQVGAASGYVQSMTKGGRTLAEFDGGKNSGWMYKVNDTLPKAGITECGIQNGDKIVWFYANDWTTVPGTTGSFGGKVPSPEKDINEEETKKENTEVQERPAFTETTFADVTKDDWHYESIKYVYENNLMQGTGNGFEPESKMTRAMLVTVLYRMAKPGEKASNHNFADVPEDQWYSGAISWAASNGIVSGITSTEFAPDSDISREQMALIIYRFAKLQGYDVSDVADISSFADTDDVSDWALGALSWANKAELVNGTSKTTLSPKATATRAQVAAILMRFCETLAK